MDDKAPPAHIVHLQLCQWVLEMCDLLLPIYFCQSKESTYTQKKATAVIQPTHPTFKASFGWFANFISSFRHSLMLCYQTSIQQNAQLEAKLAKFLNGTKAIWEQHKFPPELIINMEETPMCFGMASQTPIVMPRGRKRYVIIQGRVPQILFFNDPNLYCFRSDATSFCDIKVKTEPIL